MTRILPGAAVLLASLATPAWGSSIKQRVGGYTDNQGLTRQRVAYDASLDGKPSFANLTATNYAISATHDQFRNTDIEDDEYTRQVYGTGTRANEQISATATQTWDRLTDTRLLAAYATDRKVKSRTWGGGASTWLAHESVKVSVDVSRTVLEQPFYQILDLDFQEVGNPPIASSTGATVNVRHLATPTTMVDYTASRVVTENRPNTNTGSLGIRQYVPPLDGAVHATVTRAYNRGYITTQTTYGQVDAWIGETAWLQNLWQGGRGRVGYRYYREDETTRAYGDEKVFGSDTVTVSLAQDLPKKAIDSIGVPLTLDASAARYLTNVAVAATALEVGVTAKF